MTKQTTNLNLNKPDMADQIALTISQLGSNFDILDTSITNNTTALADSTSKQGDITQLNTTDKSSIVNAVKEIKTQANTNGTNVGTLTSLKTTDKTNLVNALNEMRKEREEIAVLMSSFPRQTGETTDDARILRAINYCTSNKIGRLHFDYTSSAYTIAARVFMNGVNNLLFTSDKNVVIKFDNNVQTSWYGFMLLFEMKSCSNITFDGVAFDGNMSGQSTPSASKYSYYQAFDIHGCNNISFLNCNFSNFFSYPLLPAYYDHHNVVVADYPTMSTYLGIRGFRVINCRFTNIRGAIQSICADHKDFKFIGNVVDTFGEHGFSFYPYANEILIDGNTIKNGGQDTTTSGVSIRLYENSKVAVTNNIVDGFNTVGIAADTNDMTRACTDIVINNNVVRNYTGGYVGSTGSGIGITGNNITANGNTIVNAGSNGLALSGAKLIANNNMITGSSQYDINLGNKAITGLVNDRIVVTGNVASTVHQTVTPTNSVITNNI